jgi:hypothetical protein
MDYQALFGMVVRAFGLVLIWSGIYDGLFAILMKNEVASQSIWTPGAYGLWAAFHIIAGLVVLKTARFIVGLAYDASDNPA